MCDFRFSIGELDPEVVGGEEKKKKQKKSSSEHRS